MPGAGGALDHRTRLVEHESVASVHLGEPDEVRFAHASRGRRLGTAEELIHPARSGRAALAREGEAVALAPRARPQRQRQPPGERRAEPAGGEDDRLVAEVVDGLAEPDVAGPPHAVTRQALRARSACRS